MRERMRASGPERVTSRERANDSATIASDRASLKPGAWPGHPRIWWPSLAYRSGSGVDRGDIILSSASGTERGSATRHSPEIGADPTVQSGLPRLDVCLPGPVRWSGRE
jgi:hypothetical protein